MNDHETVTNLLTEFLLARIGEDEAGVKAGTYDEYPEECPYAGDWFWGNQGGAWWHMSSERALTECEAKRRIIAACEKGCECHAAGIEVSVGGCEIDYVTLRALALVYADHADYQEEWAP